MAGLCIMKGEKVKLLKEIEAFIEDEDKATVEYEQFGDKLDELFLCNMGGGLEKNPVGELSLSLLDNLSKDEKKHSNNLRDIKAVIQATPECE